MHYTSPLLEMCLSASLACINLQPSGFVCDTRGVPGQSQPFECIQPLQQRNHSQSPRKNSHACYRFLLIHATESMVTMCFLYRHSTGMGALWRPCPTVALPIYTLLRADLFNVFSFDVFRILLHTVSSSSSFQRSSLGSYNHYTCLKL